MDTICDYKIRGPHSGSGFGGAIGSGDVNGDNYKDLIVGACGAAPRPGGYLMGQVYIYYGGPNFDTIPDVILNGGHNNDHEAFGRTVSGSGDVNNDGFSDIIVGAMNYDWDRGRIYIYLGGNPMDTIYDIAMSGEEQGQSIGQFGVDFTNNLQAFDHAITSTPLWGPTNPQGYNPGKIYVLFGGNPMDSIPDVWMIGRTDASTLGMSISSAGDLTNNFDGEIISGGPVEYNSKGTSYIWLGGASLDTIPDAWLRGIQYDDGIGWMVASAGDVDGDGRDEIMVSNYASNHTPKRVWVCKYTGQGIEENRLPFTANRIPLEMKPNPAKSVVRVRCPWFVKEIRIYDIAGKIVKVLDVDKTPKSGQFEMKWDLRDNNQRKVANGIYFIEVTINAESGMRNVELRQIRKITVIK